MAGSSAQDSRSIRPLLDATGKSAPLLQGMLSSGDASSMPPGYARLIKNGRVSERSLTFRGGSARPGDGTQACPLTGTLTILGFDEVQVNGTQYLLAAAHGSSSGFAAVYTINQSTGAWTEITASSGKYGDTRLGNNTDEVSFAVVPDPETQKDYVVIQNGVVPPRLWDEANSIVSVHEGILQPPPYTNVTMTGVTYWAIYNVSHTFTNSAARMTLATSGTPVTSILLTIKDNVAQNDNSKSNSAMNTVNTTTQGSEVRQLLIWFRGDSSWTNSCKVEVSEDGTTWFTVHDPSSTATSLTSSKVIIEDDAADRAVLACFIDHISTSSRDALTRLRITWVAETQTGSGSADLYSIHIIGLVFGGQVPASSKYAVSWLNSGSRAESPTTEVGRSTTGDFLSNLGGAPSYNYRLPLSPDIYLRAVMTIYPPNSGIRDKGVDYTALFRLDPNETRFSLIQEIKTATYSGSWAYVSGVSQFVPLTYYDNSKPEDKKFDRNPLGKNDITIPPAHVMQTVGARLWVGDIFEGQSVTITGVGIGTETYLTVANVGNWKPGMWITISGATSGDWTGLNGRWRVKKVYANVLSLYIVIDLDSSAWASGSYTASSATGTGQRRRGDVYFSAHNGPFRFSKVAKIVNSKIDQSSASYYPIQGETIKAFKSMSVAGIDHNYIWTNRGLYFSSGLNTTDLERRQSLGTFGVISPRSIARHGFELYWVDQDGQVRAIRNGQIESLARQVVDNYLIGAARKDKIAGAWYRERYYIAFEPEGTSQGNKQALVFDERAREVFGGPSGWTLDEFAGTMTAEFLCSMSSSNSPALYAIGKDGKLYQHDTGTAEYDTSNIAMTLTLGEITPQQGIFGTSLWERVFIFMDAVTGASWSIVATGRKLGANVTVNHTLSINGTGSVYRASKRTSTPPSFESNSLTLAMTASAPSGTKIQFIGVEETFRPLAYDESA